MHSHSELVSDSDEPPEDDEVTRFLFLPLLDFLVALLFRNFPWHLFGFLRFLGGGGGGLVPELVLESSLEHSLLRTSDSTDHNMTYRKRKGKYRRKNLKSSKSSCLKADKQRNTLLHVFQRHYDNLVNVIRTCPLPVASKLFSKAFISQTDTLDLVTHGQDEGFYFVIECL